MCPQDTIHPFDTLLIAASFFGYSAEIRSRLEKGGRSVLWREDRPGIDTTTKALIRLAPSLIKNKTEAYFNAIIEEARQHDIRDVLMIKAEALTPEIIQRFRKALPKARFTLFFWDSYLNMPADSRAKVDCFDRTFSFDPVDAEADVRLQYRPLFYLNEYAELPTSGYDIDVLFIGTSHTDRYSVLSKLARRLPKEVRFERVLFMPSTKMYYARKLSDPSYWKARKDEFVFKPLKKAEVMALIRRARVVVDIERPIQTGYTMRTIEMLGSSRKLITTNPRIDRADFYHPDNQVYIDREDPMVPDRFLSTPWQPVDPDLLARYSLDGWLKEVLG